jgi:uncharacterized protein (TIGR02246 family)
MDPRTPEECDARFAAHVNASDVDGLVALYEPDGVLLLQDGTVARGHTALREALTGLVSMRPRLTMDVTKVVRSGGDLAVLYNDWSMEVPGPDGTPTTMRGKAIEIVRRQADGTWRFAVDDPSARG